MNDNHRYPALMIDRLTSHDLSPACACQKQFKHDLITRAGIASGQRVLDLGAGTGTLAIMLKQSKPAALVTGLDSDAGILAIAREKAARAGADIRLDLGHAAALPYPDASFDRVLSSLVMSLLSRTDKQQAVREAYRVLRSGGELHSGDFGPPHTRWGRLVAPLLRRFDRVADNLHGLLPALLREAGFEHVEEGARFATVFGTLSLVSGRKPGG
jgi:ubiquinone/menaquinone biosynthesis C-methylase UbiE